MLFQIQVTNLLETCMYLVHNLCDYGNSTRQAATIIHFSIIIPLDSECLLFWKQTTCYFKWQE